MQPSKTKKESLLWKIHMQDQLLSVALAMCHSEQKSPSNCSPNNLKTGKLEFCHVHLKLWTNFEMQKNVAKLLAKSCRVRISHVSLRAPSEFCRMTLPLVKQDMCTAMCFYFTTIPWTPCFCFATIQSILCLFRKHWVDSVLLFHNHS